jgi:hypothetical protein
MVDCAKFGVMYVKGIYYLYAYFSLGANNCDGSESEVGSNNKINVNVGALGERRSSS